MATTCRLILRSVALALLLVPAFSMAETVFVEAEDFAVSESGGWKVVDCRTASSARGLHGSSGDPAGVARKTVALETGGQYRIWVRYQYPGGLDSRRGPFDLSVSAAGKVLSTHSFDLKAVPDVRNFNCTWDYFDVDLPVGAIGLELSKHRQKNCGGYSRTVDCVLLTNDLKMTPTHTDFGPQTYLRVTIGEVADAPVYVHIFTDHFRRPWGGHYNLSKAGTGKGLRPAKDTDRLQAGEQTPWCNITPMLYQDSGAILNMTLRHAYYDRPEQMKAKFEFATAPNAASIVRTLDVEAKPNGVVVVMPPDLTTELNRSRFGRDLDFSEKTGKLADATDWPTIGKKPSLFPFFVTVSRLDDSSGFDQSVIDRELKTLDYFGFSNWTRTVLKSRIWKMIDNSYCRPDITAITNGAAARASELIADGKAPKDVVFYQLADEPGGHSLEFMAADAAYQTNFVVWLKGMNLTPTELGMKDWANVRTVLATERVAFPELYYYSQRFRTRALGDFMALQRRALETACGGSFPVNANFSDGPTYSANFYSQGVDYFDLLDNDGQNSISGEDWANGSSSYQCGAYNVDLMRCAARERGQLVSHLLVAYAGRRPFDIKLKAAGNVARGVKILRSFCYGLYWGSHEGGPSWKSSLWQNKPDVWRPHAELVREIGGVEEMLMPAMPPPAEVAILYSSSSDIWTVDENHAYGFNRMHTWMALTHAQIPVDFLSEAQVARGALAGYRVCYLDGPNLTRAAATKLAAWVNAGGTLVVSAGAGARDEYNRPFTTVESLLPATRETLSTLQSFAGPGRSLKNLNVKEAVTAGETKMNVLSVSQALTSKSGATIRGTFNDNKPAWIDGSVGNGRVHCLGFLPALDYIREALVARNLLVGQTGAEDQVGIDGEDAESGNPLESISEKDRWRLDHSMNPWDFPASVREAIVAPAREAGINPPVVCSVPLVDAVYMTCDQGIVIPLANYTLFPLAQVAFSVRVDRAPSQVESVHRGKVDFQLEETNGLKRITFSLPLDSTDYITIQ